MTDDHDLIREFLVESREGLDGLDRDLVALERDPHETETLARIFRAIHTIKGTCGFLALGKLEAVSHVGETLLSRMRDGEIVLDAGITTALLEMVDAIREILNVIEATGTEGTGDYSAVTARLKQLSEDQESIAVERSTSLDAEPIWTPAEATTSPHAGGPPPSEGIVHDRRRDDPMSLRIDVTLLDKLMNLVGELVLARNQILQFAATERDTGFAGATQRLNLVTSELQEGVMKTRMQPIGNIWGKLPRVVRDLAAQCGKQVRLEMEGEETDLDKTIIEAIKDPLTHIIRNSVDHGIERPDARLARGKTPQGCIRLRALHEGGQINIEISDDGAGIDPGRVKHKALTRGVITSDQAARMTDAEAQRLIFLPGFSTADTITNVSGRGVGMDVVKTNIEKIGGQVDIHSTVGAGTTLRIKIPLTLAIIPALLVCGGDGERYAIPQVNLLELVRVEGAQAAAAIERVQQALFYRLRGRLLPLLYLDQELGLHSQTHDPFDRPLNIVVLKADDRPFGLVVEAINDTEEIVVKPLGKQLKGVNAFAGATVMGDGKVALIIDVLGLAQRAAVVSQGRDRSLSSTAAAPPAAAGDPDVQTLLLFRAGTDDRLAIPLHMIARLEEFPATAIERSGAQDVVQYRGAIMPLVDLSTRLKRRSAVARTSMQVVVFQDGARAVGLVVDQILDITTERVVIQPNTSSRGVFGSAVIQQRVTDLLDIRALLSDVVPEIVREEAAA